MYPTDVSEGDCGYCRSPIAYAIDDTPQGKQIGYCSICKTPIHVACWNDNGGCATPYCIANPKSRNYDPASRNLQDIHPVPSQDQHRRMALDELEKAVRSDSDQLIVSTWEHFAKLLKDYEPARALFPRIQQAQRNVDLLRQLEAVLERKVITEIYGFRIHHPELESIKDYGEKYKRDVDNVVEQISNELSSLKAAISSEDGQGNDRAIEVAYDTVLQQLTPIFQRHKLLGDDEIARIRLALKRLVALREFEIVMATNSHRAIADSWDKNEKLFGGFKLAEPYLPLARSAKQCVQQLSEIERHHARGEWREVIGIFDSWREHFEECKDYRERYQTYVENARKQIALHQLPELRQSIEDGDDLKVSEIYIPSIFDGFLTPDEQGQAKLAVRRVPIVQQMQEALARKDWHLLVNLYDENVAPLRLRQCKAFTGEMRFAVVKARQELASNQLEDALKSENENQMVNAADAAIAAGCILQQSVLQRVVRIKQKQAARERYGRALTDDEKLIAYDDELLGDDAVISSEVAQIRQRRVPLLALRHAIARKDIRSVSALVVEAKELETRLSEEECTYVEFARGMDQAIRKLERALESRDIDEIARAYKPELDPFLTDFDKERVQNVLAIRRYLSEMKELSQKNEMAKDKVAIAQKYKEAKENGALVFDSLDWEKLYEAVEFESAWQKLTRALESGDQEATFESWIPGEFHPYYQELSEEQRRRLWQAIRYVGARARLQQALDSRDPQRVAFAYQPELLNAHSEVDQQLKHRAEELIRETGIIQRAV